MKSSLYATISRSGELALARSWPFIIALAVGALLIWATGNSPLEGFRALWAGAFGSPSAMAGTLALMAPLLLSGIAFAIAFQGGMFNAGTEGQIVVGALGAAWAGFAITGLPLIVHLPLALVTGAGAGALWAALPGYWKLWWGANEIVTTLMLNFVGILFATFMITYPLRDASRDAGTNVQTPLVLESAVLPSIWPPYRLSWGLPLAVLLAIGLWFFLQRTVLGYEMRMTGMSPRAAENAGIPSRRRMMTAMLASGALAGTAGSIQALGVFLVGITPFTVGLGFTGVAVSLSVKNRPLLVVPAALFFASLQNGAIRMEVSTQISRWVVGSVIAIVILLVTARTGPLRSYIPGKSFPGGPKGGAESIGPTAERQPQAPGNDSVEEPHV